MVHFLFQMQGVNEHWALAMQTSAPSQQPDRTAELRDAQSTSDSFHRAVDEKRNYEIYPGTSCSERSNRLLQQFSQPVASARRNPPGINYV